MKSLDIILKEYVYKSLEYRVISNGRLKMELKKNHNYEKISKKGVTGWLTMAILFLILALVSGILGFGLISGISYTLAKWFVIIFVILFVISVIAHTIKRA